MQLVLTFGLSAHIFMLQYIANLERVSEKYTFFRMAHHVNLKHVSGWHPTLV